MQGHTSRTVGADTSVSTRAAWWALQGALVTVAFVSPATGHAQDYGPFECSADASNVEAVLERHLAQRLPVYERVVVARAAYRDARIALLAARRGEVQVTMEQGHALEAQQARTEGWLRAEDELFRAWQRCYGELRRIRRYLPRAVHHLRLSLALDGALWSMPNQDYEPDDGDYWDDDYSRVWYRTPGASLQVGWERFYTQRLGVQINGTFSVGQGRFRACVTTDSLGCYGRPQAGRALTGALDVGLRVWVGSIVVLGFGAEFRVTRLPFTERVQHGNRYSVSERLLPALLARIGPEILLSADGRWWVSPSVGLGRLLNQSGFVLVSSLRLGYLL